MKKGGTMGILFTAPEAIEMAIRLEQVGRDFYEKLRDEAKDDEIKSIFNFLTIQEQKHIKDFSTLYKMIEDKGEIVQGDEEEFALYMRAYVDKWIEDVLKEKMASFNMEDLKEILEFSIGFEKDTLLFYQGLKETLTEEAGKIVGEIIEQEKKHIIILKNALMELEGDLESLLHSAYISEILAKKFYLDAAEKAESSAGKRFFSELAEYEEKHAKNIAKILAELKGEECKEELEFSEVKGVSPEVKGEFEPNKDEIADVLILAIEAEKEAKERYERIAKKFDDPDKKKIFERLSEEERKHHRILEDQFYQISNNGIFIWGD